MKVLKTISFLIITLFARLYISVGIYSHVEHTCMTASFH